jgi:hypothetical protein
MFYKKTFFLIFLIIITLFSLIIYYLYKKIYLQNIILNKIENFEHFVQNLKDKKYELNESIINHIMDKWENIEELQ